MREKISQFLSPMILQVGLGWYYKKTNDFRLNLSPLTGRAITVSKKYTENLVEGATYFGVDAQKRSKLFFGALISGFYKREIMKNIIWENNFSFYINYIENIQNVDCFISVTENEKTNLIAGLLAKHLGAKQSIIHVSTTEYIPTIQEIGAGAVISKNLSTVNVILRHLYTDMTKTKVFTFDEIDVDVIEFQPEPNSPVTKKTLKELSFPNESIVGMINHNGKIRIAHGDSIITDDDTALVFAKPRAINKLKKLFMK